MKNLTIALGLFLAGGLVSEAQAQQREVGRQYSQAQASCGMCTTFFTTIFYANPSARVVLDRFVVNPYCDIHNPKRRGDDRYRRWTKEYRDWKKNKRRSHVTPKRKNHSTKKHGGTVYKKRVNRSRFVPAPRTRVYKSPRSNYRRSIYRRSYHN